ncbi:hypothetical protein ACHAWF_018091 [Thalassiosira exigua]
MSQVTDEMRQRSKDIMSQLASFETKLRRDEQRTIGKIEAERGIMEKLIHRRDFYEKLKTNAKRGEEDASSKLDEAEKSMAVVQRQVEELKSIKADLEANLKEVLTQNEKLVLPQLERLGKMLETSKDEIGVCSRACADEEQRLQELTSLKESMDAEERDLQKVVKDRENTLLDLQTKPLEGVTELARIQTHSAALQEEIDVIDQSKIKVQAEMEQQSRRRTQSILVRNAEMEKLNGGQKMLEEKRLRADGCEKELAEEQERQHSLAAERLEIELHIKKVQDDNRRDSNVSIAEGRQINLAKSSLVKKQQATSKLKESIPQIESKLQEMQRTLSIVESEKQSFQRTLNSMKEKVDSNVLSLFEEENVEESALLQLESAMKSVAERECEIEKRQSEEKRASSLLALMRERRAITRRKIEHAVEVDKDIDMAIHVQEIQKKDISKKISDSEKRAKDFSTLHQLIKSEKVESTRLIGETTKALQEMESRRETLKAELADAMEERDRKMKTLEDEIDARMTSMQLRAKKRTDKCNSWSTYRNSKSNVERQETRIDQLKASLATSQKDVELATAHTERLLCVKRSMTQQLLERKSQLASLVDKAASMSEALKKRELSIHQIEEEIHVIELKNRDVSRSIDLMKRDLVNPIEIQAKIDDTKSKLEAQVIETERVSRELEDPNRVTFSSGEDLSEDELAARMSVLGRLIQKKKEALLLKEISAKEIGCRIKELEEQSNEWKVATESLLKDSNHFKGRVQELRRLRLAQTRAAITIFA